MEPSGRIRRAACTIIARNYLAQARVLAQSYLQHERDGHFFLLVVDNLPEGVELGASVTVLGPADLELPDFREMAFKYDVTELCTAVKPTLMARIMQKFGVEQIVYFDPDITIFRPLDEMWQMLDASNIVLIPHLLDPIPRDGNRPSEQDILIAGSYNLGFLGLHASAETTRLLDWWRERLRDDCRVDVPHGLFVDQKWIDLVPSLFDGTATLRDATYDVAYWNLHSRGLERDGDKPLVDGRPLAFFHYSGFDPAQSRTLSKHQNRHTVEDGSPLAWLLDQYAQALGRAGHALSRGWPYGYATFDNGLRISGLHRHLYGSLEPARRREFGDPFATHARPSFLEWSARPAADGLGLNPFLEHLLAESMEARLAFPEARGAQHKAFLAWAQTHGVERFGYDPRLADPSAWPEVLGSTPSGAVDGQLDGVNVYGYLTNETGIGAVARGFVGALRGVGVPLGLRDLAELSPNRSQDTSLSGIDGRTPYAINLVCVNADQHFVVKSHVGEAALGKDHYNIGIWFWELPTFPAEWADRFAEYDEVWAPSSFIANTLAAVSPIPIVRVPPVLATERPASREAGRAHLGVGPTTFVFAFVFDFASYFQRKNPLAIIQAFKDAFAPDEDVRLVIKCVNEHLDPAAFESMSAAAGEWPASIHRGYWSAQEMRDLMAACDAYVSLHRSEGLGLTMADAMAVGKPVIATAWSGNTDFMTVGNSFPVPFELVELREDVGPYRAGAVWAEPSVVEAARLMRLVRDDPALAQSRGEAARRYLGDHFSEAAVGETLQRRLALIASKRRQRMLAQQSPADAGRPGPARVAPSVPAMDLAASSHGRFGVLLKRGVNVLLRYHTHYQSEINLAFAAFMRQLAADYDATAAEVKTLAPRAQVTALEAQVRAIAKTLGTASNDLARHETYFSARPYMASDAYGAGGDLNRPMHFGSLEPAPVASVAETPAPDFADLFRGPEPFIQDRQRVYLRLFEHASNVVDLGSGRGEFLELLRERGIEATGVEMDPAMVDRCRERGLRVELADAFEYLRGLDEESVDVIFSAQFVEHVESHRLSELLALARGRLRPAGLFIAETVNPESHLAMKTFFIDLTHQRPIFPQVLLHLCQTAGYRGGRIFYPTAGGFTQAGYRDAGEYAVIAVK